MIELMSAFGPKRTFGLTISRSPADREVVGSRIEQSVLLGSV